jgi:hypothetical protein
MNKTRGRKEEKWNMNKTLHRPRGRQINMYLLTLCMNHLTTDIASEIVDYIS